MKVFFKSPEYWTQLYEGARGAAQPNVNGQTLGKMAVPIPPLEEQKRIVAKVDELMALCDRLERQQREREKQFPIVSQVCHQRLIEEITPENLHRIFDEIGTISPDDLRKTILTLAVQGKLVPQYPNDEPAEELVAQVKRDR